MPQPSFVTAQLLVSIVVILTVIHLILVIAGYSTYLERKISAYIQDRVGPNRVGFDLGQPWLSFLKGLFGLGQPLADGLKFILKEDFKPRGADKFLFTLAPIAMVIPALIAFAVIPWGGALDVPAFTIPILDWHIQAQRVQVAGAAVSIGIVWVLAVASLGLYGVVLGGWASNNKYSFLGGLRSSAQMISYEIPMGLSILAILLLVGSLIPDQIVRYQVDNGWLILSQPIAAVIFFICALAEASRTPFDNVECEQELVGGYHTEYSAMRFGLFPLSEYMHMANGAAFFTLLFLGGYHIPWASALGLTVFSPDNATLLGAIVKFHVFVGKILGLIFFIMLIRWTIPRLRYDQVMRMAWQVLIPLTIGVVVLTAVMVHFERTDLMSMLMANGALVLVCLAIQPLMPRTPASTRIRLSGSRFHAPEGERIIHGPSEREAREDNPMRTPVSVR